VVIIPLRLQGQVGLIPLRLQGQVGLIPLRLQGQVGLILFAGAAQWSFLFLLH
jgi:hypothetical protein